MEHDFISNAVQRIIASSMLPLVIPEPQKLSQWAEENFYLSAESSYVEGKWETIGWQRAIMNCISNDDVRIVDWIKSARVGATKIMMAGSGYFAEHKKRNQIFYQPTDGDAEDFCKTEIDTMLRDVACMNSIFPDIGKKSKKNTQNLKQFIGSSLRIKGAKTAGNFRRMSADVVFYDELEAFDKDVQGEGSPLTLGDKRLEGSLFPKSVRMTTPKIKHDSLIEQEVSNSDHLFKYHMPCPHCNEEQVLKWGGHDVDFGFKWDGDDPSTVFYVCEHNGCVIKNNDLPVMIEKGIWRDPTCGVYIDREDYFRDEHDIIVDTPEHVSFHIWTAYSPFVEWKRIVADFFAAKRVLKNDGDITKLKTFVNTTLGETWEDAEAGEKLDATTLHARREHYSPDGFSKRGLVIMSGWDMQDDRVEGEYRAYGINGESWLVGYFIHRGDPSTDDFWIELESRLHAQFKREDGQYLQPTRICFDSQGHFTEQVYDFCKKMGTFFIYPTKGSSTYGSPLINVPRKRNSKGVYLTMIGTDTAKDIVYNRLRLTSDDVNRPTPGYYHFPIADWCDKTYFEQLVAERKVLKKHRGRMMAIYDAGNRRNEAIDCATLSLAALKISIDHHGLNLDELAQLVENPTRKTTGGLNLSSAAAKLRMR